MFFKILQIVLLYPIQSSKVVASSQSVQDELRHKWDFEWSFTGISTFAHSTHFKCLIEPDALFDVGIIGAPFDTAVSYRPGARFGPRAIRAASARQLGASRGWSPSRQLNPYNTQFKIVDCGDIPITPFDNAVALEQMTTAYLELGSRETQISTRDSKPKLLSLGGDHAIALGALRALRKIYDTPITVVHFDAHQDTWNPSAYDTAWPSEQAEFTHGTFFWMAGREGLINNSSSIHAGLRSLLVGPQDYEEDTKQGFVRIHTEDIDELGTRGIIDLILKRVGTEAPVYLSVDIDVIDPGLCPGTGTPEVGGWTSREVIRIIRGLEVLNIVGADIVEVAPAYDGPGEPTALAAAKITYEILANMVSRGIDDLAQTKDDSQEKDEL